MFEEWRDVVGYEGIYEVSNLGNVKSCTRKVRFGNKNYRIIQEKILKPRIRAGRYLCVDLCKENTLRHEYVHRIVAIAFHGVQEKGRNVDHINRIKTDNRAENLRWATFSENSCNKEKVNSKYNGVSFDKRRNKYICTFRLNDKYIRLGSFDDDYEAAKMYDKYVVENNLNKALNFQVAL
jgi:hypothetical protein